MFYSVLISWKVVELFFKMLRLKKVFCILSQDAQSSILVCHYIHKKEYFDIKVSQSWNVLQSQFRNTENIL